MLRGLRSVVSRRELISSADTIVAMAGGCKDVVSQLGQLQACRFTRSRSACVGRQTLTGLRAPQDSFDILAKKVAASREAKQAPSGRQSQRKLLHGGLHCSPI